MKNSDPLINPPFFHELRANSERIFSFRGKLRIKSLLILFSRLRQSSPSRWKRKRWWKKEKRKREEHEGEEGKEKGKKRGWSIYDHRFIFQRSLADDLIRFNKPIRYKNPPFTSIYLGNWHEWLLSTLSLSLSRSRHAVIDAKISVKITEGGGGEVINEVNDFLDLRPASVVRTRRFQ